ncbi:MAG TPA: type IV pilin [Methanocorpusculum sp.]|nr:type IV pilin [Methanocorpusculum sp.]HJK81022.1 type IV pilin [Methanocorpusculum sp.]
MTSSSSPRDAAVSPIIATILLVVLTVTVIAVAAVVVINISEGYGDQKTVDIRVTPVSGTNNFSVVLTGGADAAELTKIQGRLEGGGQISSPIENPKVGLPEERKLESTIPGEVLLTLIGTFADGTVQTVYQSLVNVQATGFSLGSAVYPERPTVVGTQEPVVVRGTLTITAKDQVMSAAEFTQKYSSPVQDSLDSIVTITGLSSEDRLSSVTLTLENGKDIVPKDVVVLDRNEENVTKKYTITTISSVLANPTEISTYVTVPEKGSVSKVEGGILYAQYELNLDLLLMNNLSNGSPQVHIEVYRKPKWYFKEPTYNKTFTCDGQNVIITVWDERILLSEVGWEMILTAQNEIDQKIAQATYEINGQGIITKQS